MPKPHYTEAPPDVLQQMERWRTETALALANGQTVHVNALGFEHLMTHAFARGYDVRPEDVPQPATDRVATFKGTPADLLALKRTLAYELEQEARCLRLARSRRAWAALPSETELVEERRVEREKSEADRKLEQRTTEIAQSVEAERLEKIKTAARKQAAKETNNADHQ